MIEKILFLNRIYTPAIPKEPKANDKKMHYNYVRLVRCGSCAADSHFVF